MAPWVTPETLPEGVWTDAPEVPAATLLLLLEAAQEALEGYAPALAEAAPVPARYKLACTFHARDLWNAGRVSPDGTLGPEEFTLTPAPVSAAVRALLRPRAGRPRFGGDPVVTS